ncbi:MAG: fumarylacetoacetate hydrolase family protein, partial [Comamonas sp.]
MKILSFEHAGQATYGVLHGADCLVPPAAFLARFPDVRAVLEGSALDELRDAVGQGTALARSAVRALPVIPNPGKLICVGLNYKSHVAETKRADSEYPSLFLRFNDSLAADGDAVLRPAFSERFDWEGELAFVIGKGGRHIAEEDAMAHVAGYTCMN